MHGKSRKAPSDIRVKMLHGFHQTDISFLNQIGYRQTIPQIAPGNTDDKTQMRQNEFSCRVQISIVTQSFGKSPFVFLLKHRKFIDSFNISINISHRSREIIRT